METDGYAITRFRLAKGHDTKPHKRERERNETDTKIRHQIKNEEKKKNKNEKNENENAGSYTRKHIQRTRCTARHGTCVKTSTLCVCSIECSHIVLLRSTFLNCTRTARMPSPLLLLQLSLLLLMPKWKRIELNRVLCTDAYYIIIIK